MDQFVDKVSRFPASNTPLEQVTLSYADRERARQRVSLASGEEIAISLSRGTVIRGGDCLTTEAGRCILVQAATEAVSTITANSNLVQIAYHLGNRHVLLEVGDGWVRYQRDHVLDGMVVGLGGTVDHGMTAFEPEGGAYGHHHD
ncbi:MAG: urease accessory protein UreE [Pseudomonadales bacterium]|jgi:urease accessory protein|nr:urease accessory protein UreE [Pseudomonadales bacterium]